MTTGMSGCVYPEVPIDKEKTMQNFAFTQPSILQRLYDALDERGRLPRDYSLQQALEPEGPAGGFYYSDGFMEGNITGLDKGGEESPELQDGLSQILEGEYDRAVQTLQAFFSDGEDHLMNAYVESVQQWIDDHRDTLDPEPLIWFADRLLQEADQSEIIKFALSLLEFFDLHQEEELAEEIRLLAKCNEFTLFCVRNFLQWKNGQEEIWQTARQVYGWGRIAALEYLDPRTAQIRQWMLEEGWDNDVNPEYTARLLAENVDLLGVLEQPTLTAKAFEGAEALVDALLVDEPVPGISRIRQPVKLLTEFLRHCEEQEKELEEYQVILYILQYAQSRLAGKEQETVKQACGKLLLSFACAQTVQQAMKKGEGFEMARTLDLPYAQQAVELVLQAPLDHVDLLPYALTGDSHHDHHVMELYEALIPGFVKAFGEKRPGEISLEEQLNGVYMDLNRILSQLYGFPGTGEKLFLTALQSPALMNRNTALEILAQWKDLGYKLSGEIRDGVEKLLLQEGNQDVKEKAEQVLK